MNNIEKLIAETNKAFGKDIIGYAKDMDVDLKRVSTGSMYLDWATGGGFPLGRIVEIFGPYASGKTLICLKTIVEAQKAGLPCVYVDAEQSFAPKLAQAQGVDLEKLILVQTSGGEDIFDFIRDLFATQQAGVLVVDSVAALVPNYEEDNDMTKQTMGLAARLMAKGLRISNNANKGWLVIFVNQIREKIGVMYGSPETTTGGRALPFYASLRVKVNIGEKYEENDKRIGQEVKFRIEKSKVGMPFRIGSFKFFYQAGIDKVDEMLTLGLELKMAEQSGAWYTLLGERFQGKDAIVSKLKEDQTYFTKFETALREKINESNRALR